MSRAFQTASPVKNHSSDAGRDKVMDVFHYGFFAMGTRFELVVPGIDAVEGQSLAETVEILIQTLEAKLSRFDEASNISGINRRAFHEPVPLDEELCEVFSLCSEYHEKTKGAFDIAMLPLIRFWKEAQQDEHFAEPSCEKINSVLDACGMRHLELDFNRQTVRFHHPLAAIDLGGFGKGFAVQKTLQYLRYEGIESAFISFGESSVCVIGNHPTGKPWPVGIDHLFEGGRSVQNFDLTDASLSTSGNAPVDNSSHEARHGHIISPFTGYPVGGYRLLSVVSESPIDAETLSTALLVTDCAERDKLISGWFKGKAVEIEFSFENGGNFEHIWKYGDEL